MSVCTVDRPDGGAYATARAAGVLHAPEVPYFERALAAALRPGRAVLLDVSDLRLAGTVDVAAFSRALLAAGGWPTARLVLVGAGDRLAAALRRRRAGQDVLLVDDVAQARARLAERPERVSRRVRLPAAADALVAAAGRDWDVPGLADRARPVVTQLVAGVARGVLTVSLDREGLRIALRVRGATAAAVDDRLRAVRRLGGACGTIPRSDGAVVWALVTGPPR